MYHMYAIMGWIGGEPRLVGAEHTELRWLPFKAAADLFDLALEEYRPLFRRLQGGPAAGNAPE
jgi:8-oxo-dGTP diphosphatase